MFHQSALFRADNPKRNEEGSEQYICTRGDPNLDARFMPFAASGEDKARTIREENKSFTVPSGSSRFTRASRLHSFAHGRALDLFPLIKYMLYTLHASFDSFRSPFPRVYFIARDISFPAPRANTADTCAQVRATTFAPFSCIPDTRSVKFLTPCAARASFTLRSRHRLCLRDNKYPIVRARTQLRGK
jgi:hypothetical protein